MFIEKNRKEELNDLFQIVKLQARSSYVSLDKNITIEQILAFIENIHAEVRKTSRKRKLVLINSGAGNCYLSYLLFHFYTKIDCREVEIHCVDSDDTLMNNNRALAERLGFDDMEFHSSDDGSFELNRRADVVFSLQANEETTDQTMYLGVKFNARIVLAATGNQSHESEEFEGFKPVTRYSSFRNRFTSMIADSLRALLLEKRGYKVSVFDFVSSRYAENNTVIRAIKTDFKKVLDVDKEYKNLCAEFNMKPNLEILLSK